MDIETLNVVIDKLQQERTHWHNIRRGAEAEGHVDIAERFLIRACAVGALVFDFENMLRKELAKRDADFAEMECTTEVA